MRNRSSALRQCDWAGLPLVRSWYSEVFASGLVSVVRRLGACFSVRDKRYSLNLAPARIATQS